MKKEGKSCFDCLNFQMCYIVRFHLKNIIFDTSANDYEKKYRLFYETLSKCCEYYKEEEVNSEKRK